MNQEETEHAHVPQPDGAVDAAQQDPGEPAAGRSSRSGLSCCVLTAWVFTALLIAAAAFLYVATLDRNSWPAVDLPLSGISARLLPTSVPASPGPFPTFAPDFDPQTLQAPTRAAGTATPALGTAAFAPGDPTATPLGRDIADADFIAGVIAYDAERYEDVIPLMDAVIETNARLAPPYRYRGMAYWYLGDCLSALSDQEMAISLNPQYAAAWAARGLIRDCLGDEDGQLEDYRIALELDPSLAFVHHNLGVYYFDRGIFDMALEEYALSTAIDPGRSAAWSGQAEALAGLGRYPECVQMATHALDINPEEWLAYTDRASCHMSLGNYTASLADYSSYLAHDPEDPVASYNQGVVYGNRGESFFAAGKYVEAVADLRMAVEIIPVDAHSYCLLTQSYFALEDFQNTLEAGEATLALERDCGAKTYEVLARSSLALKDYEQALDYMNEALDQQSYPLGYYYRGIIFQASGLEQEAIRDLTQFLTYDPHGEEAEDAAARLGTLEP